MRRLFIFCAFVWVLTFLIGCQEDEELNQQPRPVYELKAVAGPDQETEVNKLVTLDGTASRYGKHSPHAYLWSLKNKPEDSKTVIGNEKTAYASITPDVAGVYTISLSVYDLLGNQHEDELQLNAKLSPVQGDSAIVISEDIEEETVWKNIFAEKDKPDYLITSFIQVKAGLRIEPGVVIAFEAGQGMEVMLSAYLKAIGTADDSIYFTGKEKQKGYWRGIAINSPSAENELAYTQINYGGGGELPGISVGANLGVNGDDFGYVKLRHSTISKSDAYGLYVEKGADFKLEKSIFLANELPISIPLELADKLDVNSELDQSNRKPFVEIHEGQVSELVEARLHKFAGAMHYYVSSDIDVYGALSIAPGVSLAFAQDKSLRVREVAYVSAIGTARDPIIFSSADQLHGHWAGILIQSSNNLNTLKHIDLTRAGSTLLPDMAYPVGLALDGESRAYLKLSHSFIGYNVKEALYVEKGAHLESDNNRILDRLSGQIPEALKGMWLNSWSFQQKLRVLKDFYHADKKTWFSGAKRLWHMNPPAGTGFIFHPDSTFVRSYALTAQQDSCQFYQAEYMEGNFVVEGNTISLLPQVHQHTYYNSCRPASGYDQPLILRRTTLLYELSSASHESGLSHKVLTLHYDNGETELYYQ